MISFIFQIFFKKMILKQSVFLKIFFEILSIILTLSVIYFASESFDFKASNLKIGSSSLFVFLLVGEISLILPMSAAERYLSNFSDIRNQHFYQTLTGLKISPVKFILGKILADSIFPVIRIISIIFFSSYMLNFNIQMKSLILFLFIQVFAITIFLLMAMITSLFVLYFNRGVGVFYYFQSIATILGGAYFPTTTLPNYLKNLSYFLPQTQILVCSRSVFEGSSLPMNCLGILTFLLIIFTILWHFLKGIFQGLLKSQGKIV